MKYNCKSCQGSGRIRGGGMIEEDCKNCQGTGKDLKAESYDNAKNKIKELDKNMSDDEAKKLLDEELQKLDEENKIVRIKHKRKKLIEVPKDIA
jgi:RecJ-like exonuclease